MKHAIRLEAIGHSARFDRSGRKAPDVWVALLTKSKAGAIRREYIRPYVDYRAANSTGTRGVMLTYLIEENRIYEVQEPSGWHNGKSYFLVHRGSDFIRLKAAEAQAGV